MDHLWNVAVLLQTEDALSILGYDYRSWPKVRAGEASSQRFYQTLEKHKEANLIELRQYETKGDPFVADDDVVQGPNGKTIFLPFPSQTSNLT
jgi:hypothetical protein